MMGLDMSHRSTARSCALLLVLALAGTALDAGAASPASGAEAGVPATQLALLQAWYDAVGSRRPGETFGHLVVRAGRVQLGKPYYNPPQQAGPETLRVELERLECVSFVESTLALAHCIWTEEPDAGCFVRELEAWRYRGGVLKGYGSRLHYFVDWLEDNASRARLTLLTASLGGTLAQPVFSYMTGHVDTYPALARRRDPR